SGCRCSRSSQPWSLHPLTADLSAAENGIVQDGLGIQPFPGIGCQLELLASVIRWRHGNPLFWSYVVRPEQPASH
ncbi:hypothetical protein, partial [Paracidovorax valerianellae]|uniref:hypothetical protein n=1 Tax=Paracidovorax valerianellae TaxID=187868 RepID=UPI002303F675